MLIARDLSLALGGNPILRDVSVRFAPGELTVLVGPNGAGKSTLLSVLAGDTHPDAGTVTLDGQPLGDWPVRRLARRRAVLLQEQTLAFGFRVVDVVRMGRAPWERTEAEEDDDRVVADSMRRTEVLDLAERSYPTLSGGEKGRTSFARVLSQATALLFLDEPTAALDIRHQELLLAEARRLARDGHCVVAVLHDLTLAAAYADRVVLLSRGRVAADGPPAAVLESGLLSEVYQCPVELIDHSGALVVLPLRDPAPTRRKDDPCARVP